MMLPRIRLKRSGENGPNLGAEGENQVHMQRIGKKAAGPLADGVLHDGYPGVGLMPPCFPDLTLD